MVCLELAGGPVNVKDGDLNRMYKSKMQFEVEGKKAKAVRKTLDFLADVFQDKTPDLERFNVIALYGIMAELQRVYVLAEVKNHLREWFLNFETNRWAQDALDSELAEPEWAAYKEKISHSADAQESIRFRLDFLMRDLLSAYPNFPLKDEQRDFTHLQKLTIFRRDHQTCQVKLKCDGARVVWDDWHCDHKTPWSKGGKTIVENGQVACPPCNLAKSDW